jgi:hypothetical protein
MIAKKDLKPGHYYKGICRATYVAFWDVTHDCFVHLNWSCGMCSTEEIKHIEDVTGNTDGFVPVEIIEKLDRETSQKEREIAGY